MCRKELDTYSALYRTVMVSHLPCIQSITIRSAGPRVRAAVTVHEAAQEPSTVSLLPLISF